MFKSQKLSAKLLLTSLVALVATGCSSGDGSDSAGVDAGDGTTVVDASTDHVDIFSDLKAAIHDEFGSIVVVSWEQHKPARGRVEYLFDDREWLTSPTRDRQSGPAEELLLGIPYATKIQLRLILDESDETHTSDTLRIKTDALPPFMFPKWKLLTADEDSYDADLPYFLYSVTMDMGGGAFVGILDRRARIVWLHRTPNFRATMQPQPSYDGSDLLIDHNSYWSVMMDQGASSKVVRMKIDGTILAKYDTPGLHHPFIEIPDGSILWAAADGDNETVERLSPAGKQTMVFSCDQVSGDLEGEDYCSSNTIRWNEPTGTFLYSLYSHETILEIDPESSKAIRVFGHQDSAYAFDPTDAGFWWQHGGHYTEAGTLLTSSHRGNGDEVLVVREYEIDHDARTLRLIWSFGEGEDVRGEYMGEAHRLPNGNTLHNYGSTPRMREVTPEGDVVWDVATDGIQGKWELGRTTPLVDLYSFAP